MILIEITAATDALGTLTTFYVSDARFATSPTDTPANQAFDASLIDPGTIGVSAFGDGQTGGETRLAYGEIVLANTNGQYDGWLNYAFDGRPVVIRRGSGGAYPSAFQSVFVGTLESLTVTRKQVVIRLRDKQLIFSLPVLSTKYGGSNVLPNGLDGTPSDLQGKPKPRLYGKAFNIPAPCVNTSKLTYQISDGALTTIDGVYDRGQALTAGTNWPTSAQLQSATVTAGTYHSCTAEGYFRLGSTPSGLVTADATQGSGGTNTAAQILRSLALAAGVPSGSISTADVMALDTDNSAVLGIWLSGDETFARAMDLIAGSVGAYYGFDPTGVLRMARLTAPSGTPVYTLQEYETIEPFERRPARDGDIPAWSFTVRHSKLWAVQASDIAAAVSAARRAFLTQEYRDELASDASVQTQYLLATQEVQETLLTSSADATAEATRLLNLHKVRRDFFDLDAPASVLASMSIMSTVALQNSRFGMSAGRSFRLLGARLNLARDRVTLTVWG